MPDILGSFANGATTSLVTKKGTKISIYDYYYNTSLRYIDRVGSTNIVQNIAYLKICRTYPTRC